MHGIGGSDVPAILGVSPYKSALQLWAEKVGLAPPSEPSEPMRLGARLEPAIIAEYQARHPDIEVRPGDALKPQLPEPWMRAHADALLFVPGDGAVAGLEVKAVGWRMAGDWPESGQSQDVPAYVQAQVRWYMWAYDLDVWEVVALVGGPDLREYTLERDRDLERGIVDAARRFWGCVERREPPPPQPTRADARILGLVWPGASEPVVADDGADQTAQELVGLYRQQAALERAILSAENRLRAYMGDAEALRTSVGTISWRRTRPRQVVNYREAWGRARPLLAADVADAIERACTQTQPGVRRFCVPRAWKGDGHDE